MPSRKRFTPVEKVSNSNPYKAYLIKNCTHKAKRRMFPTGNSHTLRLGGV